MRSILRDVDICVGSHVYTTEGDLFVEWSSLSQEQKDTFIKAKATVNAALENVNAVLDNTFKMLTV